jgi:antitoxin (DNA-binding transcriptional repressor) of toxin-antitoxin stability system
MKQVTLSEFKSQFDDLVQEVFNGGEVEVRDNGYSK